ncbi:hypothetical protein [Streptomyces wuyuanensis]|uniref:hypothetical protein n=1 Tax=Streptomyces wuyuanensis TaxID=1196353 RepID=UPI0036BE208B
MLLSREGGTDDIGISGLVAQAYAEGRRVDVRTTSCTATRRSTAFKDFFIGFRSWVWRSAVPRTGLW